MALTDGSVFAGYTIERRLGVGGMGVVYVARHPRLPRRVALKLLGENVGADPEFRARFEREAELAALVDHPNVVSVYDRGIEGDRPWIAMQYVDGVDVQQLLKRGGSALPPARALFILGEAAKGLDSAHRRGLLHRDVKPANILVAEDSEDGDKVLVTDFGIARALDQTSALTSVGSIAATLPFASPEQISGAELDRRSDIYSLGCTLYVMLTGALPFPRDSQVAVMNAHLTEPPPLVTQRKPALPVALNEVIARAMAKQPQDRYSSCREFASAARDALSQSGGADDQGNGLIGDADAATQDSSASIDSSVLPLHSAPRTDEAETYVGHDAPEEPADLADTVIPARGRAAAPTSSSRSKRGLIVGGVTAAVVVVVVVAGILALGGGHPAGTPAAAAPSIAPAESPSPPAGPWHAYDFVAKALPGLMPQTPTAAAYQGATCQPVNKQLQPLGQIDTDVPIARMLCVNPAAAQNGIGNYVLVCNRDRTPQPLAGFTDGLSDVRDQTWSRGDNSGRVIYGTVTRTGAPASGVLAVGFDSPTQAFCAAVATGIGATTGQDVYDHWFRDAPL